MDQGPRLARDARLGGVLPEPLAARQGRALDARRQLHRRLLLGHHDEAARALCRIHLGELLEKQERFAEAEQLYLVALNDLAHEGWGQRRNALLHLATLLLKQDRKDHAVDRLEQFIGKLQEEPWDASTQLPCDPDAIWAEVLRAEAAGEASGAELGASLTAYALTYAALLLSYMVVLTHLAGKGSQ